MGHIIGINELKPAKSNQQFTLKVRVQPRSSRNQVDDFDRDTLRLRVTTSPTEGQANAAVIALLAKTLSISKSRREIVHGHASKDKFVSVETLTEEEVRVWGSAAIKIRPQAGMGFWK